MQRTIFAADAGVGLGAFDDLEGGGNLFGCAHSQRASARTTACACPASKGRTGVGGCGQRDDRAGAEGCGAGEATGQRGG